MLGRIATVFDMVAVSVVGYDDQVLHRILLTAFLTSACSRNSTSAPKPSATPPTTAPGATPVVTPTAPTEAPPPQAPTAAATAPAAPNNDGCTLLPFAESVDLAEASGAAPITVDGTAALLVVGDSGNHGDYAIINADTGALLEKGKLPLGATSDDVEALSAADGLIYGITSAGWVYRWQAAAKPKPTARFVQVGEPYPIGAVDTTWRKNGGLGSKPPAGDAMSCVAEGTNCGRNYEGLCLQPDLTAAAGKDGQGCVGLAIGKADGNAYCVTWGGGKLAAQRNRRFAVASPGGLADCALDDQNRMVIGSNLFDALSTYTVEDWATWRVSKGASAPRITRRIGVGIGFAEVLATGPAGVVYRMSDASGAPSLMAKFRCIDDSK